MDRENWVCLNAAVADSEAVIRRLLQVDPEHGSVDDAAADVTSANEEAVECGSEPSTEVPVEALTELGKPEEDHHSSAPVDHSLAPVDHSSVPVDHSLVPVDHAWASAAFVAGDVALVACAVVLVVAYAVVLVAACVVVLVAACVEEAVGVVTRVADFGNSTEVATEHLCLALLPKWMPKIQGFDGEYFGTN